MLKILIDNNTYEVESCYKTFATITGKTLQDFGIINLVCKNGLSH